MNLTMPMPEAIVWKLYRSLRHKLNFHLHAHQKIAQVQLGLCIRTSMVSL